MQQGRTLALAMFQYANDNEKYPDGSSSTEVFQKLMDGNYVADPAVFYVPLPGKSKGRLGEQLKPENVSFDVTGGIGQSASDGLPLVFLTGYRIDYRPGGKAVSLTPPYPPFRGHARNWVHWWSGEPIGPYLAVAYFSNNAYGKAVAVPPEGYGIVDGFIPKDFNAQGHTYRQLTPEGVLK